MLAMVADLISAQTPTADESLWAFMVEHIHEIASIAFIAVTLPLALAQEDDR